MNVAAPCWQGGTPTQTTSPLLSTSTDKLRLSLPADRVDGDVLPSSCRYLRLALGTVVALLCRRHFFTLQRLADLRSPLMRISVAPSFFRNFFSTYLALIQASFSCLRDAALVAVAARWRSGAGGGGPTLNWTAAASSGPGPGRNPRRCG